MKKEKEKELKKPFDPSKIQWRIIARNTNQERGLVFPYVDARAVEERLDEVLGPDGWKRSHKTLDLSNGQQDYSAVICQLRVKVDGEWILKEDGAGPQDPDSVKGALSDSFKRTAVNWGVGQYLHTDLIPDVWVDIEQKGSNWFIEGEVNTVKQLPSEALPKEYHNSGKTTSEKKQKQKNQEKKQKNEKKKQKNPNFSKYVEQIKELMEEYEVPEKSLLAWAADQADREENFESIAQIGQEKSEAWLKDFASSDFWEKKAEEVADTIPFD